MKTIEIDEKTCEVTIKVDFSELCFIDEALLLTLKDLHKIYPHDTKEIQTFYDEVYKLVEDMFPIVEKWLDESPDQKFD